MDKKELFKIIIDIHNANGYINRHILESKISGFNCNWQLSKYGGLKKICSDLGLNYRQYSAIDPDEIISDAKTVFQKHHRLSLDVYEKYGKFSKTAIRTAFGSFNGLLRTLGLKSNMTRMDSKEDIEKDFLDFYNIYHSTSSTLYRKYGKYSQSVITRVFGSWSDFMDSVGLKPQNRKIGREEMLLSIKKLYDEYGYLSAKLVNENCIFSYQALRYYLNMSDISEYLGVENAFLNNKRHSTGSNVLYKTLVDQFGEEDIIEEFNSEWLINNQTGNRMYVDFYIKSLNVAVEYDGEQHFKYIPFIHRNYKNFFNQVCRDRLKDKQLAEHGIKIIRFKYDEPLSRSYIVNKILSV